MCRPNKAAVGSGLEYYIKMMEGLETLQGPVLFLEEEQTKSPNP
jgi:hypothetical protein